MTETSPAMRDLRTCPAAPAAGAGLPRIPAGPTAEVHVGMHAGAVARRGAKARSVLLVLGSLCGAGAPLLALLSKHFALAALLIALAGAAILVVAFLDRAGNASGSADAGDGDNEDRWEAESETVGGHNTRGAGSCDLGRAAELFRAPYMRLDGTGRITSVSRGLERLIEGPGRDLIGQKLSDRLHVVDRVAYLAALSGRGQPGEMVEISVRLFKKCGTALPVTLTIGASGEGYDVAVRAVAQLDGQATGLAAALREAEDASRAKSDLLAAVSHELRTPLNAIIGFSDVLEHEMFGKLECQRQRDYVGLIRTSGMHLLSVVNAILDTARIEAGGFEIEPERFRLDIAIRTAVSFVRAEAERKGLDVDLRTDCPDLVIEADECAFRQILVNLLSNAVKFTETGGIALNCEKLEDRVRLEVTDTGIGIEASDIAKIGKPFVQLSAGRARAHNGTGLGLSLVRSLVELHGGEMSITSQAGVGTTVTVVLPLEQEPDHVHDRPSNQNKTVNCMSIERIHGQDRSRRTA